VSPSPFKRRELIRRVKERLRLSYIYPFPLPLDKGKGDKKGWGY